MQVLYESVHNQVYQVTPDSLCIFRYLQASVYSWSPTGYFVQQSLLYNFSLSPSRPQANLNFNSSLFRLNYNRNKNKAGLRVSPLYPLLFLSQLSQLWALANDITALNWALRYSTGFDQGQATSQEQVSSARTTSFSSLLRLITQSYHFCRSPSALLHRLPSQFLHCPPPPRAVPSSLLQSAAKPLESKQSRCQQSKRIKTSPLESLEKDLVRKRTSIQTTLHSFTSTTAKTSFNALSDDIPSNFLSTSASIRPGHSTR